MSTLRYNVITKIKKAIGKIHPSWNRIYGNKHGTIADVWENPKRKYPYIIYIETTNLCNANCICCPVDQCQKPRGTMSMDTFKKIIAKIKQQDAKIGAMFCFGEPLMDSTLFRKYKYAMEQDVLIKNHIGLNTNVSFLLPHRFDDILKYTPNIILSFFSTGKEFERLTGGLKYDVCYKNAIDFIKYRDEHKPDYKIYIGTNIIEGFDITAVKKAFEGYNVIYIHDAELRLCGPVLTGIMDRIIMFNRWRCDGYKGALQIKFNGDCEYCAYDIVGNSKGGETKFANVLTDSWDEISRKFREKWKSPSSLCKRCDFFNHCKDLMNNNYKRPVPLPDDWYDWQKPYLKKGEKFID